MTIPIKDMFLFLAFLMSVNCVGYYAMMKVDQPPEWMERVVKSYGMAILTVLAVLGQVWLLLAVTPFVMYINGIKLRWAACFIGIALLIKYL